MYILLQMALPLFCTVILTVLLLWVLIKLTEEPLNVIGSVLWLLLGMPISFVIFAGMGLGIYRGYSEGDRIGYLTKLSYRGMFFKTWEAEMQTGTGEQGSLQAPSNFSIPEGAQVEYQRLMGKHVSVKYVQWIIQPMRQGATDYEAVGVTEIPR